MKPYIMLIFLAGFCRSYKLYADKSETKGFQKFWADEIKADKYSIKVLKDGSQNSTHTIPSQRILAGDQARPNSAPFLAGILLTEREDKEIWCGGSIISNRYILTAAHCLDYALKATVILGAHDRLDDNEATRQTQTVKRRNFVFHESWDDDTFKNDIALIKLNQDINFTPQIQPIELADTTFADIDFREAAILGWGYFNTSSILSQYVRIIVENLIPNEVCRETYGKYVRSTNVCLNGSSGKAPSTGDMGGPLFILDSDILIQVGLASFGCEAQCDKFPPTVFTRISKYFTWIQKNAELYG